MGNLLQGKHIILGVTGSIAAIKAPIVARELMRRGATVTAALTRSAQKFTTSLALSALTHQQAITELLPERDTSDAGTWHIRLARAASAMLIAPCSASTIGKLRAGIYDNPVTLLASALPRTTPLVVAPAMDEEMWLQSAVHENLEVLRERGMFLIEPTSGALASGLVGQGRMLEPDELIDRFTAILEASRTSLPLYGKRILITGGPTFEPLDPVRYIGNRSSGKMAAALANVAHELGADVTLIMGPTNTKTSNAIERIDIETAAEMHAAVRAQFDTSDILIMNAAVSDFAAANESQTKLKKRELADDAGRIMLELRANPDILSEVAAQKRANQIIVGFALETGDAATDYARGKLEEKKLDFVVLNRADEADAGIGTDTNRITIMERAGRAHEYPLQSKEECARDIFSAIIARLHTYDG